ncbi:biosynthetic peptidoglycan transglycosylase [Bdellovibrionota bacterium FG-2]
MRSRRKSRSISFVLLLVAGLGLLGLFALRELLRREFPDVARVKTHYPVVHYRGPGEAPLVTLQRLRPSSWISLNEVSRAAVGAILVSEDWAFYQHRGYDPNQIREALKKDLEEGGFARGASTITQQVVKNVFLERDKTIWRKLKELYLAVSLEESLKKNRILELYLNIAEWGPGVYGIGPATQMYFKKTPQELTAREGAFLAMLLPSPIRYGQSYRAKRLTDYAASTIDAILSKMVQANYLTEEERAVEASRNLSFEESSLDPGRPIPQNQE